MISKFKSLHPYYTASEFFIDLNQFIFSIKFLILTCNYDAVKTTTKILYKIENINIKIIKKKFNF